MFLASLLAAAAPQPPAPSQMIGGVPSYISDEDYPAEAIRNEEQGTVSFALDVSVEGKVTACRVTASSGSEVLDSTTCRILTERARLTPARDSRGKAAADVFQGRIRWQLPEDTSPFPQSITQRQINNVWEVTAGGTERACRRELMFEGGERFDLGVCLPLDHKFVAAAAAYLEARPEEILTIRLENRWIVDPVMPFPAHEQHLGELLVRGEGDYRLNEDLTVRDCIVGRLLASFNWRPAPCFRTSFSGFVPAGTTGVRLAVQWVVSRGPDTQRPSVLPRFVAADGKVLPVNIGP